MRFDLEDLTTLLGSLRTDSKLWSQQFLSTQNLILKGFIVTGVGLNEATVTMTDATLLMPQNTADFSYFIAEPAAPALIIPDADLVNGTRNYVEMQLCNEGNTPLSKVFWDSQINGGNGAEFSQIVDTIVDLKVNFITLTAGFSGLPDSVPLAIMDVSPTGAIESIFDRRELFGRLSKPNNLANEYAWGTKQEPIYSLTLTGVAGVFLANEGIAIGGESATVVTGGAAAITFKQPSGINFFPGASTVTGGTSGATGTIATVSESFTGVDKDLGTVETILKAVMTEIKGVKGTPFWYDDAPSSLANILDFLNSTMTQNSLGAKFQWDGSNLSITDEALVAANTDQVAAVRQLSKNTDMFLTRQSTGQELQLISFDAIPDGGTITLDHNADVSNAINPSDDAATVQAALNATWTATVTVTGNFAAGFRILFDTPGPVAEHTIAANSLTAGASPVVGTPSTIQNGYAGGASIPIADGEILFVQIPLTGSRTFSDAGVGNTNYQTAARGAFVSNSENYWVAYREGGLLYIRGIGELEAGEETAISDPDKETLLNLINTLNTRSNQDRNAKLISGGTWSVVDNAGTLELTNSANAQISIPGLQADRNRILPQTISFPNATSVAVITALRTIGADTTRLVSVVDAQSILADDDVFVIARRTPEGLIVGTSSFLLKAGELLEMDGALAEVNRLLGQLKIVAHETDADKARITGADTSLLDGNTLSQIIGDFIVIFGGAVIDFTTGEIFESDGVTPLGANFTPFTIPVGEFFWYGIALSPSSVGCTLTANARLQINLASAANPAALSAEIPSIGGDLKRGWVQIRNNAGTLEVSDIRRLGAGAGTGGGVNPSARGAYEDRLDFSIFQSVSATVFSEDLCTFVDESASTGDVSPADGNDFRFPTPGDTLLDINNATSGSFLNSETDLTRVELFARWNEGAIDPAATYEVSRDGGNEYQAIQMERVGTDSNAFRGFHLFDPELNNQILDVSGGGTADRELTDTGAGVERAVQWPVAVSSVIQDFDLTFNKLEAVAGNLNGGTYRILLVKDVAGVPSLDPNDVIAETPELIMDTLIAGVVTYQIAVPQAVVIGGDLVWVVVATNAAYKAAFIAGVDSLSIRVDSVTPSHVGGIYDGVTWSAIAESWFFRANGRALDLRIRMTSSIANVLLESYGIYYHESPGVTADTGDFDIDVFTFNGTDNLTNFVLTNVQNPIPGLLEAFDEEQGSALLNGTTTYQILGNTLVFAANYFNRPGIPLTLKVRQIKAGIFDNSDANAAAIAQINSEVAFRNLQNFFSQRNNFDSGDTVTLAGVSGDVIIGSSASQHLAFDQNTLQSKLNATSAGTLRLQPEGGLVTLGDDFSATGSMLGGNIPVDRFRRTEDSDFLIINTILSTIDATLLSINLGTVVEGDTILIFGGMDIQINPALINPSTILTRLRRGAASTATVFFNNNTALSATSGMQFNNPNVPPGDTTSWPFSATMRVGGSGTGTLILEITARTDDPGANAATATAARCHIYAMVMRNN